jgi:membrane protein implicated in regulation of membrane protease activity
VLLPGTTVYVVDRENLTLVVEPALPVKPAHN